MPFESTRIDKSKPPLRWIANLFGEIGGWAVLKAAYLDEDEDWGFKYKVYGFIYSKTMPLYTKYGTWYQLDLDQLKLDMSGPGWNDYDEEGIPYWEKWELECLCKNCDEDTHCPGCMDCDNDFIDEETGDAFRIINGNVQ